MIVRKNWERWVKRRAGPVNPVDMRDLYTGWFLFGVIPLYIIRNSARR